MIDDDFSSDWSYLKSSIDTTEVHTGRPFGGCGFICKKLDGIVYKPLGCVSERICGIEIIAGDRKLISVYGVYMPCDSNRVRDNECFLETLNELQGYIDNSQAAPCMIVGDTNTRLPQAITLSRKWYKTRGFSKRSCIFYDFICDNELCVLNFCFSQPINYTWFNANLKSYIDHMLFPHCMLDHVSSCEIVPLSQDNTSDHLPLQCTLRFELPSSENIVSQNAEPQEKHPCLNWDLPEAKAAYQEALSVHLASLRPINLNSVNSVDDACAVVNSHCASLTAGMHRAVADVQSRLREGAPRHKRKHWWTQECTTARDRMRIFFHIWKSCGRPTEGPAYECYRDARKNYRRACRAAVRSKQRKFHQLLTRLYHAKRPGQFWNLVRRCRSAQVCCDGIGIEELRCHYATKFAASSSPPNGSIQEAQVTVSQKYAEMAGIRMDVTVSERKVTRMIKKLRKGCSPGVDGILAEHLQYGLSTSLALHIAVMMTLCLRYGCIPHIFRVGVLVPILKKPHLDPSKPGSYRPITVSVVLSKLLELYVLEECSEHRPHPCQFGFVTHRGTNTAIALAHDVSAYCVSRGTPTFLCSLDAEGAFDNIPHPVLFQKAALVLPNPCWRIMYNWYTQMTVSVKWNGCMSSPIPVERGTRQGGLSSPFLFNIFYEDLIGKLNEQNCGITIKGNNYNAFCYADDILIASTSPSGLQTLIDVAVEEISRTGLRFNPTKTICMIYGNCPLTSVPSWNIDDTPLQIESSMKYLGAMLSNDRGKRHIDDRIQAANRAFYSLQGAGLHFRGVTPHVAMRIYQTGVRTILTYGCESICISNINIRKLESAQGKLVKCVLGLKKFSRTSPLLRAVDIPLIKESVRYSCGRLLKSAISHFSNASRFYSMLLCSKYENCRNTLVSRCCFTSTDFMNMFFNDRSPPHMCNTDDGLVDSIKFLLTDYNQGAKETVQMLVNAF